MNLQIADFDFVGLLSFIDVLLIITETEDIDELLACSSRPEDKNGDLSTDRQANSSSILDSERVLMFLFSPLIVGDVCGKKFTQKGYLGIHLRTVHSADGPKSSV